MAFLGVKNDGFDVIFLTDCILFLSLFDCVPFNTKTLLDEPDDAED